MEHTLLGIDLNLLMVFVVVYREGSVTRAATILGVTQPAISNALLKLRTHFNDTLFRRQHGRMRPTVRAEQIYQKLSPAIDIIQQLQ